MSETSLHVKSSISNLLTLDEFSKIPPGIFCEIGCILHFMRLRSLSKAAITNISCFKSNEDYLYSGSKPGMDKYGSWLKCVA